MIIKWYLWVFWPPSTTLWFAELLHWSGSYYIRYIFEKRKQLLLSTNLTSSQFESSVCCRLCLKTVDPLLLFHFVLISTLFPHFYYFYFQNLRWVFLSFFYHYNFTSWKDWNIKYSANINTHYIIFILITSCFEYCNKYR